MTDQTDAERVEVTQVDRDLADAIAAALAKYQVAYTHVTLTDMSTAGCSWKVHEACEGNPFERNEWLGEFDNKAEANEFCTRLRREAAYQIASAHRLASTSAGQGEESKVAVADALRKSHSYSGSIHPIAVTLGFHTKADRDAFIDAHCNAIRLALTNDGGAA